MNKQFAEYTSSCAFHLNFSKSDINEMWRLHTLARNRREGLPISTRKLERRLLAKGVIDRPSAPDCQMNWVLNVAGRKCLGLFEAAGHFNPFETLLHRRSRVNDFHTN